jgi:hypothetical protein
VPPTQDIGKPDFYWGTWGQGLLTEWWETAADLIWPQSVITFGKMRHDPQLKAVLGAFIYPIVRANWQLDGEGCRPEVVQRCADNLGLPIAGTDKKMGPARRRGVIWQRHVRQALYASLVFGHMPFERRYELMPDGFYNLAGLGPRMPWTLATIRLQDDGTLDKITQTTQAEPIPGTRLVWYGHEIEGSAWAGMSMLRPAFGAWLLKHESWRVHTTSIRRFGMGVPTVEAPPGATATQVAEAQALAAGVRAGDQTGAGMPSGFKFGLTGLTGSVPDAVGWVRYLDQQMSKMALAGIIDLGQTETGSRALGETFLNLFILALQAIADDVALTATSGWPGMPGIVTDLVDVNWGEDEPAPRVICPDVGEQHEVTAQSLFWLLQFGALTSDPELEAFVRQAWKIPQRKTPQPEVLPKPPGGGSPPSPAPAPAPAPGGGPTPPAPDPKAGRGGVRAGRLSGLRRELTPAEVRAGLDPLAIQDQWAESLDLLLAQWPPIFRDQRDALADQVAALVDKGRVDKLAGLAVDSSAGAALLKDAMITLAGHAAAEMAAEAASQGVTISLARAKVSAAALGKVATARAALAGSYISAAASRRALQVVTEHDGSEAAGFVSEALDGLSQISLRDQLGAALSAAQNAGRVSVLEAAPESAGDAQYVATEVLDDNTCDQCEAEDGIVFASLEEAQAAYANGGYIDCQGGERCRGTVMAIWSGQEAA